MDLGDCVLGGVQTCKTRYLQFDCFAVLIGATD